MPSCYSLTVGKEDANYIPSAQRFHLNDIMKTKLPPQGSTSTCHLETRASTYEWEREEEGKLSARARTKHIFKVF